MSQEKFKTMIGGQALIEGIMMRGPQKDAIVTCSGGQLHTEVMDRKLPPKGIAKIPFVRGVVNFFDAQITGVKALMKSAEAAPEEYQEEQGKVDAWLEKKLGSEKFQKVIVGIGVFFGLGLSIALFFVLPMIIGGFFYPIVHNNVAINLIEGLVRMVIFAGYMLLVSRMQEMRRVFAYHGAEHKTICCYEAGLPLTVENVKMQTRLHPRCGTSFLLVVMLLSILVFSVASTGLLALIPALETMRGSFLYRLIMIVFKLLLLPLVVGISYEINRWVGRHNNGFTKILTAPGLWMQNFTTNEPDEDMIRTGIAALEAVLPENEGEDRW